MIRQTGRLIAKKIQSRLFSGCCLLVLLSLNACSTTKQIATAGNSTESASKLTAVPADTLISETDAENLFVDAVRDRITGNMAASFDKYTLLASAGNLGATPHYELARIWIERNNIPRALHEIETAVKKDSVNKWFQIQLADLLAYDGQYARAANVFHKLAQKERNPEEYLIREVFLYKKAQDYKKALALTDQLITLLGEDDEAVLMERQQLYLNLNDVEGAAREVGQLIRYYPYESKYLVLLANIYQNNGLPGKAAEVFKTLEDKFAKDADAQVALIVFYLGNKDFEKYKRYFETAMANKEMSVDDRIKLILPLSQGSLEDKDLLLELAALLARQEDQQWEALLFYSELLTQRGALDSAREQLVWATKITPPRFEAWQQLLVICLSLPDTTALIHYGRQAIEHFPDQTMAYYLTGLGHLLAGENTEAIPLFQSAIRKYKDDNEELLVNMLVSLGDAYNENRQYQASDSCYRSALKLNPDNVTTLNNFSYYLSERGEQLDEAATMSALSLKLRPGEPTFLDTYGWILYKQGKYEEAKKYLQQALDQSKDLKDGTIWEHLGDVEYKLGNTRQALEHWQKAQKLGGHSELLLEKIKQQQSD